MEQHQGNLPNLPQNVSGQVANKGMWVSKLRVPVDAAVFFKFPQWLDLHNHPIPSPFWGRGPCSDTSQWAAPICSQPSEGNASRCSGGRQATPPTGRCACHPTCLSEAQGADAGFQPQEEEGNWECILHCEDRKVMLYSEYSSITQLSIWTPDATGPMRYT